MEHLEFLDELNGISNGHEWNLAVYGLGFLSGYYISCMLFNKANIIVICLLLSIFVEVF